MLQSRTAGHISYLTMLCMSFIPVYLACVWRLVCALPRDPWWHCPALPLTARVALINHFDIIHSKDPPLRYIKVFQSLWGLAFWSEAYCHTGYHTPFPNFSLDLRALSFLLSCHLVPEHVVWWRKMTSLPTFGYEYQFFLDICHLRPGKTTSHKLFLTAPSTLNVLHIHVSLGEVKQMAVGIQKFFKCREQ